MWLMISLDTVPAGIRPGHRITSGTRNAPSQLVFFSPERGHRAVGPAVHVRAVVGGVDDDRVLGDAELVQLVQDLADVPVVVDHRVVVVGLPPAGLARGLGGLVCVRKCMWVVLTHRKNGTCSACLRSMKSIAPSTISSSIVSIRLRVSGPVSSISCEPSALRGSAARRAARSSAEVRIALGSG
jgi:hypothetical protein